MRIVAGGAGGGSGERRRWALGPLAALAVVIAVCTGAVPGTSPAPGTWSRPPGQAYPAGRGTPLEIERLTAVREVLDRRATALLRRDRAGWLAGVDPAARGFRARQAAFFEHIGAVPLGVWRYTVEPEDEAGEPAAAGRAWTVRVTLRYTLRGIDPAPTIRPLVLTFMPRGERWLLAADDRTAANGVRSWRGPWEYGPMVVHRGRSSLVLAHPVNADRLQTFADAVDAAVPRVTRVVGTRWPRQVAVLIPDDQGEMAALVGERLALGKIAAVAVADAVDPSSGQARGQRVVVNPANLDRLGLLGRRVVLQHEVTHVATRGITGHGMPIWLVEGFADWVGYLDSGLSARLVGDELHAQVRSGRWPGRLPTAADFRGDSPRLAVAYEEAWSACRLIAARAGPGGLLRFYRAIGRSDDPAAAVDGELRRAIGMGSARFLAEWRRAVRAEFG